MDEYEEWDDTHTPLEKGDILFRNDEKRTRRDIENGYGYRNFRQTHFFGYAIAYKAGADRLVEALAEDDYWQFDLVLPIVFLYRHYLELALKHLIQEGKKALGQPVDNVPTGHNILRLWDQFKPILAQTQTALRQEEQSAVETCIKELSDIDEKSEAFRYPVSKEGEPLLKNNVLLAGLRYIDLQHFAENMKKIESFLLEADMGIITYKNRKSK